MKRVIITGATGAIGVALSDLLIQAGCEVYAICRPGSENINNLRKHEKLNIVECDIADLLSLENKLIKGFDAFYHLAWIGTIGPLRNSHELQLNNLRHTLDAVVVAKNLECRVFIGTGSQAEYGHFNIPADENTITQPFTLYGAAKLSAGHMSRVLAKNIGLKHIWVRIFSVYGPYDDTNTLISYLIRELKQGISPDLTSCEQIWDYLHSYDAAEAMIMLAIHGLDSETYCLGSGKSRPLKDYVDEINEAFDTKIKVNFGAKPYSENQVMYLCANIDKLVQDTGFSPKYIFKSSVKELIKGGGFFEGKSI
ncbi:MAG: NAD(P)-dependent oxidoreductase [Fusobacteria bacterium]|nr:NAD(P)-dependent oxidoreductase [Fusobacteriota bacterium]